MSNIFLSNIAIRDFRTFGQFEIDIPAAPGLVLVTGTNGLGKSSFFDAIEWGLTGKIRRFDPYLGSGKKMLSEGEYLTRRGADAGAHSVSLTFSGNEQIERGALGNTPMADIITQLAQPDRPTIKDLSTYLALTHFLGQAAQQRFTSRDSQDQWQSLKGPSGIDRLERIRRGLRGRPTSLAFNRRIKSEQASITEIERNITDWQEWMLRLKRLHAVARASGILTPAEVSEKMDQLQADLLPLIPEQSLTMKGDDIPGRLTEVGDLINKALRANEDRKIVLNSLAPLVVKFSVARAESQTDTPGLVRLRSVVSDVQSQVNRVQALVAPANDAVTAQREAIAQIEQNITSLEAHRIDLARRVELAGLVATAETDLAKLRERIAAYRATITEADQAIEVHAKAVAELARLSSLAATAKARDLSMAEYLTLEENAAMTAIALEQGREVASVASINVKEPERELAELDSQIADTKIERADAKRHATAISEALSKLASHMHDDDTNCPLCRTSFEPGVLKELAEVATGGSDGRLKKADEALERLETTRTELVTRIAKLSLPIKAVEKLQREAEKANREVVDARGAIALVLGVPVGANYVKISAERRREADSKVASAKSALEPMAAKAAASTELRTSTNVSLDKLLGQEGELGRLMSQLRSEDVACADRIAARQLSYSTINEIDTKLSNERGHGETARARLLELNGNAKAAAIALQRDQLTLDAAQRDLAASELIRSNAENLARQLQQRWSDSGLSNRPSQDGHEQSIAAIDRVLTKLQSFSERQLALAKDNEDVLLQGEIVEISEAMRLAGGDDSVSDPAAHLTSLQTSMASAVDALRVTKTTFDAVKSYSKDLQDHAEDFSSRVLDPLNTVIDDFNEAMLSTPGESVQFKANTRVDATNFGMALKYRERVEHAIETEKELPPQVVLSEGQLAANGFSILCAASTAYPWSRWRALLLDDPLQHNDIIHTAAFVDVMRNMVELNGYQLILSSHDRGESEFIARKFDAANLPCTKVLLTAPSVAGVTWQKPEFNQAAARILRRDRRGSIVHTA